MSGRGTTMSHHVTMCSISATLPNRSGVIEVMVPMDMSQFGKMWMTNWALSDPSTMTILAAPLS